MAKRGMGKSIDDYIALFKASLKAVLKHKSLWVFGLITAVFYTGSLFTTVVNVARRIEPAGDMALYLSRAFTNGAPWLLEYASHLIQLDSTRVILTVTISLVLLMIVVLIVLSSQYLLLSGLEGVKARRKQRNLAKTVAVLKKAPLTNMLFVNVLTRLALALILIGSSLPLAILLGLGDPFTFFVFAAFYTLLVPIAFLIDAVTMFTLITITKHNWSLRASFGHAWRVLKKHWLTTLEVAVILYVINLSLPILAQLFVLIVAGFTAVAAFASLSTGTTLLMVLISLVALTAAIVFLFVFIGFLVSFNYSVWVHLFTRFEGKGFTPLLERFGSSFRFKR